MSKKPNPNILREIHKCELHLAVGSSIDLKAVYTYEWGDAFLKYGLLSEVAEILQPTFERMIKVEHGLARRGTVDTGGRLGLQDVLSPIDNPAGRRWAKLMPGMVPRWVRVYDNGGIDAGGSFDQYTAVYTGRAATERSAGSAAHYPYRGMSTYPSDPQGFGQFGSSAYRAIDVNEQGWAPAIGRNNHLGTRIKFEDLPEGCQRRVIGDYLAIWQL